MHPLLSSRRAGHDPRAFPILLLGLIPAAVAQQPSKGPAVGLSAVVGTRDVQTGATFPLRFKGPGLLGVDPAPKTSPLPGPGAPLVTPQALHLAAQDEWFRQLPPVSPPAGMDMAMAYDSAGARVLLFGGLPTGSSTPTWGWDGATWTPLLSLMTPAARTQTALASDTALKRVLLFGGAAQNGTVLDETWEWDGSQWYQLLVAAPSPRFAHAMAYDAARNNVVLFGGRRLALGPPSGDTWIWDATGWHQLMTPVSPSARSGHAMAYDAVRQRVVLFGGDAGFGNLRNDTWEWNGTTWTQVTPGAAPSPRASHAMAYDAQHQAVVMTGSGIGSAMETWLWNGATWSQRDPCQAPAGRFRHGLAFDPVRSSLVLFGGIFSFTQPAVFFGDTWQWRATDTQTIEIHDFSIGQDFIPAVVVGGNIRARVPPNAWIGLAYSVTRDTVGTGTVLEESSTGGNGPGADIFTYVFRGSTPSCLTLPAAEIGTVRRAVDATEGTGSGPDRELNGVDLFLSAYNMFPSYFLHPPPVAPPFYFTVAPGSLPRVPHSWWAGSLPSAASILWTKWNPGTGKWNCPTIWLSYDQITFNSTALLESDVIDALSVGTGTDSQRYCLISTTRASSVGAEQILIFNVNSLPSSNAAVAAVSYQYESHVGGKVMDDMELGNGGDNDGHCAFDPCNPSFAGTRGLFDRIFGTKEVNPFQLPFPETLFAGAWREGLAPVDNLHTFATGGPRPGLSLLAITLPGPVLDPFIMLPMIVAGNGPPYGKATQYPALQVPPDLKDASIILYWFETDAALTNVAYGRVKVKL